jgi:hypothetical protein
MGGEVVVLTISVFHSPMNINYWLKGDLLILNFDKTYFTRSLTHNSYAMDIHITWINVTLLNLPISNFLE